VLSAKLRVYHHYSSKPSWLNEEGIDRVIAVNKLLVDWVESQANSQNRKHKTPWSVTCVGLNDVDAASQPLDSKLWVFGNLGWKGFNVTSAAQDWVDNPGQNFGVVMWAVNEQESGHDRRFYAREHGNKTYRPELVVIYE